MSAKTTLDRILEPSKVRFNGPNPWDPQVHDTRTYARALAQGSLGFGEAYMDGWWDCADLSNMFNYLMAARIDAHPRLIYQDFSNWLISKFSNPQSITRSQRVGRVHYDRSIEMFTQMLGPTLAYSCGYWRDVDNLNSAQEQKYALICRKLQLQPGDRLLEIGCGWGGFLRYACEHYQVQAVGVTISENQAEYARQHLEGLNAEVYFSDYRDIKKYNDAGKTYNKIVSIGMFEHVGVKNYATFFATAKQLLTPDGLFLLHTIGSVDNIGPSDPWIDKYIFPDGKLPGLEQIDSAIKKRFIIEDLHNFGAYYDLTLSAWLVNFERYWQEKYVEQAYMQEDDKRFYRMWTYYLASCAGLFRARNTAQLWQFVLSPNGVAGGYNSVR